MKDYLSRLYNNTELNYSTLLHYKHDQHTLEN